MKAGGKTGAAEMRQDTELCAVSQELGDLTADRLRLKTRNSAVSSSQSAFKTDERAVRPPPRELHIH